MASAGLWEVTWALTKPAPKVPLNVDIGPERCFCWCSHSLGEFKQIKDALGGTVNDVSLAVTAGALRRWLHDREVDTRGWSCRRWCRSRSAPRTSMESWATG